MSDEIKQAIEALTPFAKMANGWIESMPDDTSLADYNYGYDEDGCVITLGDCRRAREAATALDRLSGRVTVTTADKARKLWALLDDIDTLDDACRDDDRAFRDAARRVQRRRFDIMTGEEWDALAAIDTATAPSPDQIRREALREAVKIADGYGAVCAADAIGALIAKEGEG